MTALKDVNIRYEYLALVPCPKTDSNSSPGIGGALQICTKRVGGWQRLVSYGVAPAVLQILASTHQVLYLSPRTGIIARASPEAAWRLPLFGGRKLEMEKANQPFSRRRIVFFHDEQISPRQPQTRHRLSGPRNCSSRICSSSL